MTSVVTCATRLSSQITATSCGEPIFTAMSAEQRNSMRWKAGTVRTSRTLTPEPDSPHPTVPEDMPQPSPSSCTTKMQAARAQRKSERRARLRIFMGSSRR